MTVLQIIETATKWMEDTARDNSHGYSQIHRWGPDYDCSSAVISAWQRAGVPVKTKGATYTGNMYNVFIKNGFKDITATVNLRTGGGLQRGDVLLNIKHHVAMYCGSGKEVEASIDENGRTVGRLTGDQTGREFLIRGYRNYPWDKVLRFVGTGKETATPTKTTATKTTVAKHTPGKVLKDESAKKGKKYKVTASSLNLREDGTTAFTSHIIAVLHKNDSVMWYGYHQYDAKDNHWLFVIANGKTGWVCEKEGKKSYLTKA